jgi:hypothetical protein
MLHASSRDREVFFDVAVTIGSLFKRVEHGCALNEVAENCLITVQIWRLTEGDRELAADSVLAAGRGGREKTTSVVSDV